MGDSSSSEILKIIAAHSVARIRGLENLFVFLTWGYAPGFMLPPASQA